MTDVESLPRILVIDDLYGRTVVGAPNQERQDFCRRHRLIDVTGDQPASAPAPMFSDPIAAAVFIRGQVPAAATLGDVVRNDPEQVLSVVREDPRRGRRPWALVLLDLYFVTGTVTEESEREDPGIPAGGTDDQKLFGLQLLSALNAEFPDLPVAILSSIERHSVAEEWIGRGAVGYFEKANDSPAATLRELLRQHGLIPDFTGGIIGDSPALLLALRAGRRAANHDRPVLLLGERGTGKELLARYVHAHRDPQRPFVAINCGLLSEPDKAFSALFGHRKGAFTGALSDRQGLVLAAKGGILFLDEVSSLPLNVQQGLHRLLQEGEVAPLGAHERPIRDVDVKVLAASNVDLGNLARKRQFMPDLLDRLMSGTIVKLPSLRDRLTDLLLLVELFVRQEEKSLAPAARARRWDDELIFEHLRHFSWPGNVRQLESCVKQAVSTNPDMEILHPRWLQLPDAAEGAPDPVLPRTDRPLPAASSSAFDLLAAVNFDDARLQDLTGRLDDVLRILARYIEAVVKSTAQRTIDEPDGAINVSAAGKLMTGDKTLKSSQPADVVKRHLKLLETRHLLSPFLRRVYERAAAIRDRSLGAKRDRKRS